MDENENKGDDGRAADQAMEGAAWVAAFLNIPLNTLYSWNHKGIGPPAYRLGKHLRYRPAEVEGWLQKHRLAS